MVFLNYRRKGIKAEITMRDESNAKIETFKMFQLDGIINARVIKHLKDGYGFEFKPEIDFHESVNELEKQRLEKEKVDWLNPDLGL